MTRPPIYLILHNIRSAYNVGSIFRTADAAGVGKVYLTGYSPRPVDKFGQTSKEIAKTALGAEQSVDWEAKSKLSDLIKQLKKEGVEVVAVEQSQTAIDYRRFKPRGPMALIFGNEVTGLSSAVLDRADQVIEIPMLGQKESLNVSVAAGVVVFGVQ